LNKGVNIAFHSLFAQNAFNPVQHRFGGSEKRTALLAKMVKELGYSVGILMADPGQGKRQPNLKDGIVPLYHAKYRLKAQGIEIRKPVFESGLLSKIKDKVRRVLGKPPLIVSEKAKKDAFAPFYKAKATLWVGLSLNDSMLELAQFCQESQTPFLLGLAHDMDLDFLSNSEGRDAFGASREKKKKTMDLAAAVVVQNRFQEKTLRQYFPSIPACFLPNPIDLSACPPYGQKRSGAVWIGKMDSNKNPLALLHLAQKIPQLKITMVSNPADAGLGQDVLKSLPSNVKWIQSLSHPETLALMALAEVHLSTSLQEGFPNTFLEAAAVKTPTVSLHVDPDNLMQQGLFGFCAGGNENLFVEKVLQAMDRNAEVMQMLETTWSYVQENHAYERVKERWGGIVQSVMQT
jgi:glycosyltransferase involved in cell wall biosynthesis